MFFLSETWTWCSNRTKLYLKWRIVDEKQSWTGCPCHQGRAESRDRVREARQELEGWQSRSRRCVNGVLRLHVHLGVRRDDTENPLFAVAASWMAMVNLFNLLPINPLDGGRIMKSIAYSVHSRVGLVFLIIGILASGLLAFKVGLGLFVFLLIVGGLELVFEYKRRMEHLAMNGATIFGSAIAYASVAGVLWGLMAYMEHIPGAAAAMELLKG